MCLKIINKKTTKKSVLNFDLQPQNANTDLVYLKVFTTTKHQHN